MPLDLGAAISRLSLILSSDDALAENILDIAVPCSRSLPSKANLDVAGVLRGVPMIDFMSLVSGYSIHHGGPAIAFTRDRVSSDGLSISIRARGEPSGRPLLFDQDRMVAYLNSLVEGDRRAVYRLLSSSVPVSDAVAQRDDVPVRMSIHRGPEVSILSLLNMLCGYGEGDSFITWDIDEDQGFVGVRVAEWSELGVVPPTAGPNSGLAGVRLVE